MFVRSSHPLSPYLYALHDRVHGLSTTERALQEDKMDPIASAGACGPFVALSSQPPTFT